MDTFEKYLLLGSLSFFFGCLAVSLMVLYNPAPRVSYLYSPALEEAAEIPSATIKEGPREYAPPVPESVIPFPSIEDLKADDTVFCFLEDDYNNLIVEKEEANALKLVATAQMETDKVEIYANDEGVFSVFVIGPDAIGQTEACEVANGDQWNIISP